MGAHSHEWCSKVEYVWQMEDQVEVDQLYSKCTRFGFFFLHVSQCSRLTHSRVLGLLLQLQNGFNWKLELWTVIPNPQLTCSLYSRRLAAYLWIKSHQRSRLLVRNSFSVTSVKSVDAHQHPDMNGFHTVSNPNCLSTSSGLHGAPYFLKYALPVSR